MRPGERLRPRRRRSRITRSIAQNLYRLKNGRFDQIGLSWLKHGFTSTNSSTAGCSGATGQSCTSPPAGGNQLGIGCTDPYVSSLNGSRPLGTPSEVNGTTGVFPFPYTQVASSTVYDERVKVATADVDAASTPAPSTSPRGSTSPATTPPRTTRSTTPPIAGSPSAPPPTTPCR